jgi:tetratricopeptide (TPR) repeat protein
VSKVRPKPAGVKQPPPQAPKAARPWLPDLWICLLLLALTLAVYSQVRHFDFVNYDDPDYVTANSHVRAGLTAGGVAWAFTSYDAANWFPLTWLSHMTDSQLFGLQAGWCHLTNVWLHALAALLLFAVLRRMTGARWPSALVAFLFALHPLHVESVAWVAERKDVLSAFFWCLTLWCYARYAERPGAVRYLAVLVAFALGLMAKPMVVTLPFVLLLLDVWPLRRALRPALLREKAPLVALAAAVSLVTFLAQRHGNAVAPLAGMPALLRVENGLVSYVAYMVSMMWPSGLAVFYPYPASLSPVLVAAAGLALAGISLVAARQFNARPYLAVGWCWYLGTLAPVIGLVQVGGQARADRYTYLPMVGLSIMLAWGVEDLVARRPGARKAVIAAAVAACCACMAVTWRQLPCWTNSETLFRHALDVTSGNYLAHSNLATYYLGEQRNQEARDQAAEALRIKPHYVEAHVNLASALSRLGDAGDAEAEYRVALHREPDNAEAHSGLGAALALQQRTAEALAQFQTALRLKPEYADGHYNLGKVLAGGGRNREAAAEFAATLRLQPDNAEAHHSLGMALAAQGNMNQALEQFAAEAQLRPGDANAQYNMALALANMGRLDEAIGHFSAALRLRPDFEAARRSLAVAVEQRNAAPKR